MNATTLEDSENIHLVAIIRFKLLTLTAFNTTIHSTPTKAVQIAEKLLPFVLDVFSKDMKELLLGDEREVYRASEV